MKLGRAKRAILAVAGLLLLGGALGGGWLWGRSDGRVEGYQWGLRAGEVRAARAGPPEVRDRGHAAAELLGLQGISGFGVDAATAEAGPYAALLNRAPSPCGKLARRGISLATTLLEHGEACPVAFEQARLALVALRSFPGDVEEALAVLRVERRVRPRTDGRPSRGPPDADVVLVEWGDFQCPYCARAQGLVEAVLEEVPGVKLVWKHLPLSFHEAAIPAALAAEAAAEQGKFWEMHDALFAMQDVAAGIDPEDPVPAEGAVPFEAQAAKIGLDVEVYRRDFRSDSVRERVESDAEEARATGVGGTPTFWVDAREVGEPPSPKMFALLADKARAEHEWRFSWDLVPPPKGAEAAAAAGEAAAD